MNNYAMLHVAWLPVSLWLLLNCDTAGAAIGFDGHLLGGYIVSTGENVTLPCVEEFGDRREWHYYSRPGLRPQRISLKTSSGNINVGMQILQGDLFLTNVQPNNSGIYECKENGRIRAQFQVRIRQSPRREFSISEPLTVSVGDHAIIRCTTGLMEVQPMMIHYYRSPDEKPVQLTNSRGELFEQHTGLLSLDTTANGETSLLMPNAQLNQSGFYECIEDGGIGPGRGFVQVTVVAKASESDSISTLLNVEAYAGNNITFNCSLRSGRRDARWLFRPRDLSTQYTLFSNQNEYVRRENGPLFILGDVRSDYNLYLTNISCSDAGVYECYENQSLLATVTLKACSREMHQWIILPANMPCTVPGLAIIIASVILIVVYLRRRRSSAKLANLTRNDDETAETPEKVTMIKPGVNDVAQTDV